MYNASKALVRSESKIEKQQLSMSKQSMQRAKQSKQSKLNSLHSIVKYACRRWRLEYINFFFLLPYKLNIPSSILTLVENGQLHTACENYKIYAILDAYMLIYAYMLCTNGYTFLFIL